MFGICGLLCLFYIPLHPVRVVGTSTTKVDDNKSLAIRRTKSVNEAIHDDFYIQDVEDHRTKPKTEMSSTDICCHTCMKCFRKSHHSRPMYKKDVFFGHSTTLLKPIKDSEEHKKLKRKFRPEVAKYTMSVTEIRTEDDTSK